MTSSGTPSSTHKAPFYAFAADAASIATLKSFADAHSWSEACVKEGDIHAAIAFLKQNPSPEFLLVEIPSAEKAPGLLESLAEVCDPDTKVAVAGEINEFSFYRWLTDIGIVAYLLKPLSPKALEEAWQKTHAPAAISGEAPHAGKIVGVIGTRGGAGASSIAILLAALAAENGNKTALVDLDPQDGSAALLLDLEPSRGFREALERPDRIDSLFLERSMNRINPLLHVLSSEESLHERVNYHDQAAETLLRELRMNYALTVLDLPRSLHAFSHACASACDTAFAVTELTLAGLNAGIRLNEMFKEHLKRPPPVFAANKAGMTKHEIPVVEYAKGIHGKVEHIVPFAPEIFMTLGGDLKALKNTHVPAIKTLSHMLAEALPQPEKKEGKEKIGKFAGFFRKGS